MPCPCFAEEPRETRGGHLTQAAKLHVLLSQLSLTPSPGGPANLGGRWPVSLCACSLRALDICGHNPGVPLDPGAMGSPSHWVLVLSAPKALADCCCWGPPWLSAHQRVKCFPRHSPGKPRQPPAEEHIKEEAFLPAASAMSLIHISEPTRRGI